MERAAEALRAAAATKTPFVVSDADPLMVVSRAWERFFDGQAPAGELEVAVADAIGRWRAGDVELPDYYLVVEPEELPPTLRHWYLGVLSRHAPTRVVPAAGSVEAIGAAVARLRAGRWWPELPQLLSSLESLAPDEAFSEARYNRAREWGLADLPQPAWRRGYLAG
jgi:hypothetical protein